MVPIYVKMPTLCGPVCEDARGMLMVWKRVGELHTDSRAKVHKEPEDKTHFSHLLALGVMVRHQPYMADVKDIHSCPFHSAAKCCCLRKSIQISIHSALTADVQEVANPSPLAKACPTYQMCSTGIRREHLTQLVSNSCLSNTVLAEQHAVVVTNYNPPGRT